MIAISLALAFKEGDQNGNQQAQRSLMPRFVLSFFKGKKCPSVPGQHILQPYLNVK